MRALHGFCTTLAALVSLTGCGGGGGGGSQYGISLSPASVSINTTEGNPPPAATIVHVNFVGDGVVVGYAPGVAQPSWLSVVQQGSATQSSVDFALSVSDTTTVGTRTTSVRFVTGKADGSDIKSVDLPVTYTLAASDLALSTSTSSLTFSSGAGGASPSPQTVDVTYNGTAVSVANVPTWLSVTPAASGTSPVTYTFTPNGTGFSAGTTLTADVVFSTSRPGSPLQRTSTVHVSYNVLQPFDATASVGTWAFTSVAKSAQVAQPSGGYTLTIWGSKARWRITSDSPWLKLSPASGSGGANVVVTADASAQPRGTFSATVTVTDDDSGGTRTFQATLNNRAARLLVSPSTATFNLNIATTLSDLTQSLLVTDELGGTAASEAVTWSTQSVDAPWLQWAPGGGTSSPSANGSLSLKKTEIEKLVPGQYTATVTLSYTSADGSGGTLQLPVTLNYNMAYVTFVGSYIGLANTPGSMYVRGSKFAAAGGTVTVSIGSTDISGLAPDGDTQVRVNYPALAAGRYPVSIKNQAGILATNAELVILNPPSIAYHAITATSVRQRLVYDAERTTLYGVNLPDQEIEIYRLSNGTWSAGSPYVLPNLTDIALTPNGRSLIVLTQQELYELALPMGTSTAQPRVANPDSFCGQYLDSLAMANDGRAFVISDLFGCSGYTPSYLYDITTHTLGSNPYFAGWLYDGIVDGAADGSKLFAGIRGISPVQPVKTFNALDDSIIDNNNVTYNLDAVTVSGNASRVILENVDVYSGSMTLLGHLPAGGGKVLASRDSSRAYVYRDDGGTPRLNIYDLNGALGAGAIYPLLKTVNLTDSPNSASQNYFSISMAEAPDGNTVFVSGDSRIVVQPVN